MEKIIREYKNSDYTELFYLLSKVYNSNISQETLEKNYISSSRKILVAVNENEHIIGCSFVELQEDYVRPSRVAYVTYVAVDESYRKQGIGRSLFVEIESLCNKAQCNAIELTSANFRSGAHAFYKSLGFTKKDTTLFIKEMDL